jgi:hypothetical protein
MLEEPVLELALVAGVLLETVDEVVEVSMVVAS